MIRNFWVKNYLSIGDKQELNFVAKGSASELVAEMPDGTYLYKLGVLYGSNASGKSNMLWALDEVFHLLAYPKGNANIGGIKQITWQYQNSFHQLIFNEFSAYFVFFATAT